VTCRSDSAGFWTYRTCPEDPPLAGDRLRAVVRWVAVDEITGTGPDIDYTIQTDQPLAPRIAADGIMGLVGNPARVYPKLKTKSVDIDFTLFAPGYITRELKVTLGPVTNFPTDFAAAFPLPDGVIVLHRQPFVLRGRVVQLGGLDPAPVPGVSVSISGVWWTPPPANVDPATVMQPANLVSLQPGLYSDCVSATDGLRSCTMTRVLGQDKTLTLPAVAGEDVVKVSDIVGVVAPGTVLAFEPLRPDRVEYVVVDKILAQASTTDQPATLQLKYALQMSHEEKSDVWVVTPTVTGANNLFNRDGVRSDRVAFLAGMTGVTGGVVEIGSGTHLEYQTATLYTTTSDSDGYYRLPPLSRVASVQLQTPALTLVTSPDYGRYENLVDVVNP
jgi:hypothetical protein